MSTARLFVGEEAIDASREPDRAHRYLIKLVAGPMIRGRGVTIPHAIATDLVYRGLIRAGWKDGRMTWEITDDGLASQ
jgi:hypothetical protein